MRVIAGRLGGRRLHAPRGRATRPTAERVREALFSMLGPLREEIVLDLFAGTGALAIEALSRGAARAVLVERDRHALEALRRNLSELQLGPAEVEVRREDALRALRKARQHGEKYDLVFIDPPYDKAGELDRELAEALPPLLAPGARVVVESDARRGEPSALPIEVQARRRYGDTSVTIHRQP